MPTTHITARTQHAAHTTVLTHCPAGQALAAPARLLRVFSTILQAHTQFWSPRCFSTVVTLLKPPGGPQPPQTQPQHLHALFSSQKAVAPLQELKMHPLSPATPLNPVSTLPALKWHPDRLDVGAGCPRVDSGGWGRRPANRRVPDAGP